jgi:hypothetical protein
MTNMDTQELQNRIQALEDIVFSLSGAEFNRIVANDKLISREKGILIKSSGNPTGFEIRTGKSFTDATIKTEVGTLPDGSLYITSQVGQWPLWVKYGGTWIQVTLP